ncbi:MAG: undecaprenyldiphospho-muramoylpentapeptide beta-N-acetylglucosaminyltransferase [Anaerolineae bacterium]|nr:undecaprenyldiphospho-muramoylpentapeptide beta-N-acetylglucosaminyltransferase [Anaerolineae bacterium]MBT7069918.1 undecaprenyldiphospho-muramoylpentapeptide beta-N-acetylglucosaminyltransferase [Anaerolineae bacterium]MBT7323851.1 undecaprenyldiphospho-muramoylpentapeptide beta-N-acetylglucosaminyltransferase [Anaerolineae bacterium]
MRLLICAGGTGGGVTPALAVLAKLPRESVETLWVGGEGGMEAALVERQGIPFATIPAAGVHGVGLRTLPKNIVKLMRGVLASRKILREFKPNVLFFTGGYVAVPMAIAGINIPSLLCVPDIEPGLALKALAWFADKITVTAPTSSAYFSRKERIVTTGYPLRNELTQWEKASARKKFDLNADEPVLLVFGGSKGARSINNALIANLPALLEKTQVVHISGKLDWETVQNARNTLAPQQAERYRAFDYLHEEMGAALASADLVISRAGASSLGEFPLFGLPALLVPYPYAWRYQKVNAEYLEDKGAARMIRDEDLQGNLLSLVSDLLDNSQKLNEMHIAMKALSRPQAAENIAQELLAIARKR